MTIEKFVVAIAALTIGIAAAPQAHAAPVTITAAVGGGPTVPDPHYVNFDDLALGSAGGTTGGVSVAFSGGAQAVTGNAVGWTAPFISHGNGALFGDATVRGQDTTTYLSSQLGSITVTLPQPVTSLGFLWGSVDIFNTLSFYNGTTLIDRIGGGDLVSRAVWSGDFGDTGVEGTVYVNFLSNTPITSMVASSSGLSFEIDNLAYDDAGAPAPVPEPFPLGLLALGLLGIGYTEACRRSMRAM